MFGSFPPSPLVVCASKVYSGLGADIVMESLHSLSLARTFPPVDSPGGREHYSELNAGEFAMTEEPRITRAYTVQPGPPQRTVVVAYYERYRKEKGSVPI